VFSLRGLGRGSWTVGALVNNTWSVAGSGGCEREPDVAAVFHQLQPEKGLVAPAGEDASIFQRCPAEGTPTWTVYREAQKASFIELPVRHQRGSALTISIR